MGAKLTNKLNEHVRISRNNNEKKNNNNCNTPSRHSTPFNRCVHLLLKYIAIYLESNESERRKRSLFNYVCSNLKPSFHVASPNSYHRHSILIPSGISRNREKFAKIFPRKFSRTIDRYGQIYFTRDEKYYRSSKNLYLYSRRK